MLKEVTKMVTDNVAKVISKCKDKNSEVFLSLKPRIDDLSTTVAHLYSYGGKMCYFNMPKGNGFTKWNKEYEKYSYGEYEFVPATGYEYLFGNWDNMIKTCENRAYDEENFKKGKISGKEPRNRYERMRENIIAINNSSLAEGRLAVIDMEYSVDKEKLGNNKITKNPKADLVLVTVEGDKIVFYITEYKSTRNGFGVSLQTHYDDMVMYHDDVKIKNHLIKTLQEREKYGLIDCNEKVINLIRNLSSDNIDVKILFLFSNAHEFEKSKKNVLAKGYKYIFEKSKEDGVCVKYACIKKAEDSCLMKSLLRDFESDGNFELVLS